MSSSDFFPTVEFVDDMKKILSVPFGVRENFIHRLRGYSAGENLSEYIFGAAKIFDSNLIESVVRAIRGLLAYRSGGGSLTAAKQADAVVLGLRSSGFNFDGIGVDEKQVKEFLENVFLIKELMAAAKALVLAVDNEKIVIGSRILTDVRPIFAYSDDGDTYKIDGYILCQQLKVSYEDSDGQKDVYFSISASQLNLLIGAAQRAERKAIVLRGRLEEGFFGRDYNSAGD